MMKLKQSGTGNKKTEACGMTKDQMIEVMRKINARHTDNMKSRILIIKLVYYLKSNKLLYLCKMIMIEYHGTVPRLRTRVFYCDPSSPYQKGACEVNHELIRRILPK